MGPYGKAIFTPDSFAEFAVSSIAIRAAAFEKQNDDPFENVIICVAGGHSSKMLCVEYGPCSLISMRTQQVVVSLVDLYEGAEWFLGEARSITRTTEHLFTRAFATGRRVWGMSGETVSATGLVFLPHYGAILAALAEKEVENFLIPIIARRLARFLDDRLKESSRGLEALRG